MKLHGKAKKVAEGILDAFKKGDVPAINVDLTRLTPGQAARIESSLAVDLRCRVTHFTGYHDGFSFIVPTELDAYKAAHRYQHSHTSKVTKAAIDGWSVSLYDREQDR